MMVSTMMIGSKTRWSMCSASRRPASAAPTTTGAQIAVSDNVVVLTRPATVRMAA